MGKFKLSKNISIPLVFFLIVILFSSSVSATMNLIVITDPSGKDPNGAAAGSMSFEPNMFQSTFLMSYKHQFAVLSGGESEDENSRLQAVINAVAVLENGGTASAAASVASSFSGIRIVAGGPSIGAAAGGDFDIYMIALQDDGTITVTPYANGLAILPPGTKGAIFHLRDSPGSGGGAEAMRQQRAIEIGKMIRDGYSATEIVGETMKNVAKGSGEKYGGGAVNLVSGISTGDMFTPTELNVTGWPMDSPYAKRCDKCGFGIGYPSAERYEYCPYDGSKLETVYAYDALTNAITLKDSSVNVFTYGSEAPGLAGTTSEVVQGSVSKNGYDSAAIATSINKGINNGYLVGVNYVEPKDINVKKDARSVGIYYTPLPEGRTSPPWNLPINTFILNVLGSIQTAIGIIIVLLVVFRSRLLKSFQKL